MKQLSQNQVERQQHLKKIVDKISIETIVREDNMKKLVMQIQQENEMFQKTFQDVELNSLQTITPTQPSPSPPSTDRDETGNTPLHRAALARNLQLVKKLLQDGADTEALNSRKERPIHCAAKGGEVAVLRALVEAQVEREPRNEALSTPLHFATLSGRTAACEYLLSLGCEADPKNEHGYTPFHYAVVGGHLAIAQILLKANVDKEASSKEGWTPLHFACRFGQLKMVEYLIRSLKVKNINQQDEDQCTALHLSASNGYLEICKLLLEHGADKTIVNRNSQAPQQVAKGPQKQAIQELLQP